MIGIILLIIIILIFLPWIVVELSYIIALRFIKVGEKFTFTNESSLFDPFEEYYKIEATIVWKGIRSVKYRINGKTYKSSYFMFKNRDYKDY